MNSYVFSHCITKLYISSNHYYSIIPNRFASSRPLEFDWKRYKAALQWLVRECDSLFFNGEGLKFDHLVHQITGPT
jgi:hypothetical protein